jgi:hypothetical protein
MVGFYRTIKFTEKSLKQDSDKFHIEKMLPQLLSTNQATTSQAILSR